MSLADLTAATAAATARLDALAKQAGTSGGAATSAADAFSQMLAKIAGLQAFGGMGQVKVRLGADGQPLIVPGTETRDASGKVTGGIPQTDVGGPVSLADLLKRLATLLETQKEFARSGGQGFDLMSNPFAWEDSIQKIVQLIQTWGGQAAQNFNLEAFKHWLDHGGDATAPGAGGAPSPSSSASAAAGAKPWSFGMRGPQLPGAPAAPPGEGGAGDEFTRQQTELDTLTAAAEQFKGTIDAVAETLTEADARMVSLRAAAGIDQADGAVATINAAMKEARSSLQYLQDKGSDAASIATQTKAVADLQTKLDAASKQQRIATYDFEHSTAYKAQLQTIADEKADLAAKQKAYAEQEARIEALKKALDIARGDATAAATKATTELKHMTDILRDSGKDVGLTISTAAGKMGKDVASIAGQTVTLIGKAADDAVKKIAAVGASIGSMGARGLLP